MRERWLDLECRKRVVTDACFADAVFAVRPDWVERWRGGMKQDQRTGVGSKKLRERACLLDSAAAEIASDADSREGGRIKLHRWLNAARRFAGFLPALQTLFYDKPAHSLDLERYLCGTWANSDAVP